MSSSAFQKCRQKRKRFQLKWVLIQLKLKTFQTNRLCITSLFQQKRRKRKNGRDSNQRKCKIQLLLVHTKGLTKVETQLNNKVGPPYNLMKNSFPRFQFRQPELLRCIRICLILWKCKITKSTNSVTLFKIILVASKTKNKVFWQKNKSDKYKCFNRKNKIRCVSNEFLKF